MDSGSGEAGSLAVTGSLQRLSTEMGVDFPRIFEARRRTEKGLEDRRRKFATLRADRDVAVVLMGSWGRGELTSRSDDDSMLLIDGEEREVVRPTIDEVWEAFGAEGRPPGPEDVFGVPVFSRDLWVFTAYDEFLAMLDDDEQRGALEALATEDQESSEAFATAKRLGKEIRSGLLSLLFDTPVLYPLTREFAIF
jgi:hypothetical protein